MRFSDSESRYVRHLTLPFIHVSYCVYQGWSKINNAENCINFSFFRWFRKFSLHWCLWPDFFLIFTDDVRGTREGDVFAGVYHSVQWGLGFPDHELPDPTPQTMSQLTRTPWTISHLTWPHTWDHELPDLTPFLNDELLITPTTSIFLDLSKLVVFLLCRSRLAPNIYVSLNLEASGCLPIICSAITLHIVIMTWHYFRPIKRTTDVYFFITMSWKRKR